MPKKFMLALTIAVGAIAITPVINNALVSDAHAFSLKGAAKAVGGAVKNGAKKVGGAVKDAGKKINLDVLYKDNADFYGGAAKKAGKAVAGAAKCLAKGGCAKIGNLPRRPQVVDHRSVGQTVTDHRPRRSRTIRDHRVQRPQVRDHRVHRTQVRDYRTQRTQVRDHRAKSQRFTRGR